MNKTQNRRDFLSKIGMSGAAAIAVGAVGTESLFGQDKSNTNTEAIVQNSNKRSNDCAQLRRAAAQENLRLTPQNLKHPSNNDENLYPNKIANYTKGLPHNSDGTVIASAYNGFLLALNTGEQTDSNSIPLGGDRKLTNPQAGSAFDMEGADSQSFVIPPAPAFASREQAAEIAENYWMAILRDTPFSQHSANSIAQAAAADLSLFGTDFKGAKNGGIVTADTLFRGLTTGDKSGQYLSQFFYQPCNFGANKVNQKIQTAVAGQDYMTDYASWLAVQNGINPQFGNTFDPTARYMRNGRDIGQWVHIDVLFQAYFQAFLILAGLNAPVDNGNPYAGNPTQDGFGTFGNPHIAAFLCEVATRALKAVWFQKWFIHRRLRPEVFAARVDRTLFHGAGYPVHTEILNSLSTASRLGGYLPTAGNALLPQAFPEGSPTHPSYGAGHATVAGACVTILKAWFNESTRLVDLGITPLQPTDDGLNLIPYTGADADDLTIGGELNKLASNVGIGRDIAGVHWRSDATESLKLGEAVAISILRDQKNCYSESFNGFTLTKFNGSQITV